ncbi:RNA-directed DNA polymerase [Phyllobacterium sp. CCNWLW109]|uniref:RNA-directed DNA polymerase n=1 Tax=Phyllobacterium sp. CCNWLW109 TaxID=3127479 RepID=UPI003077B4A3
MGEPSVELFVKKGLLPENLPPVFSSNQLWAQFENYGTTYIVSSKCVGEAALFNASKRGGQRRIFSIQHPAFVRDQALFFEKNWENILPLIESSKGSASKPIFSQTGNRHVRITPHTALPKIRLKAFSRFKFCLVTDVARFFPSIYTHSIPWALNGKMSSKEDNKANSAQIWGNRLDFILRQSQSRQTIGIAVGPDTSKIVSEILLASVDQSFINRSGKNIPIFIRHVDDYWVGGNTQEECEKHLQHLRMALREFELDINESKTRIISTKLVFGDDWPFELTREVVRSLAEKSERSEPLSILSSIVDRATIDNDEGIIRHTIRAIDRKKLWSKDWEMLEHFLAQCAVQFPHSIDYVARVIAWRHRVWSDVDLSLWQDVALLTINQNAATGRDSEVIWSLWLMKELNIKVSRKATDVILANSGPLPLALLSHFSANKLTLDRKLRQKLWATVAGNPYSGPSWPLTLEMVHLGISNPAWEQTPASDSLMGLHNAKVSIINWNAQPRVFEEEEPDGDGDAQGDDDPDYAIEDYGSDYGDEDEDEDENLQMEETLKGMGFLPPVVASDEDDIPI